MDTLTMAALGKAGAATAISLAAMGSAIGTGNAGMAAIGSWKKCYVQDKTAPYMLLIFIGAPLSQTIYGMILMNAMHRVCSLATYLPAEAVRSAREAAAQAGWSDWVSAVPADLLATAETALTNATMNWPSLITIGVLGGTAMAMSAIWQGRTGAAGADALSETGKGFGNYLMAIGVVETVALFVLVFIQASIR